MVHTIKSQLFYLFMANFVMRIPVPNPNPAQKGLNPDSNLNPDSDLHITGPDHQFFSSFSQRAAIWNFFHEEWPSNFFSELFYLFPPPRSLMDVPFTFQLFSAKIVQRGSDEQGLLGFLHADIKREIARGRTDSKLVCSFCNISGATLQCSVPKCKVFFHYPCGAENSVLFQHFGNFR